MFSTIRGTCSADFGGRVQHNSGDMFSTILGTCSKKTKTWIQKKTKTKTKLLPTGHAPTSAQVSLERKRLKKELLAPAPGRSRVGELNPRRIDQNRSWNKSEQEKCLSPRGNLGKLHPWLSLLHAGQSTEDNLIRKDYYYYYYYYLLQLGCHPVAVVILHLNKTWNWLLLNLSLEGYMRNM